MYAQYVVMSTTANNHLQFALYANSRQANSKKYLTIEHLKKSLLHGSTKSKTGLSFHNIYIHQIKHLEKVLFHGGIAFFLIYFITLDEVYLVDAKEIVTRYNEGRKKSISLNEIKSVGHLVEQGYIPRLHYLDVVDKVYFNEKNI